MLWTDIQKLPVPIEGRPTVDLNVPLQQAEGVYTVHVAVSRPSGYFRDKFFAAAAAPLAERSFEVVVIDPRPAARSASGHWVPVLEIDPTNPRWIERLPSWTQFRRIPGLSNHGSLGSIRAGAVDLPLGRFIELPPTVAGADPHWQGYTLPLEAVGVPHMLEIDYPADAEQQFGLSIVEPNAAGVVEGEYRDSGVYVEGLGRSEVKHKQTQRLIFWPRTQSPLLVVTNQHPTAAARFGQLRVYKRVGSLTAGAPVAAANGRLMAAYLARPLAAESLGATQANEIANAIGSIKTSDDSQTLYESVTRLADYVQYGGYNSAVVGTKLSDVWATPGGQGATIGTTDGLDLSLRVFDRERLTLLPAIEFAAPLSQLEELRRKSDPRVAGLEWVGPDGRTWLEANGTRGGRAPYYNLLDPRVQEAILGIVRNLVARYGNHAAFGGLAVQLSSDGYAQLPPLEWGMDDATIARFERATGIALTATGPGRFAARSELLSNQHAEDWRSCARPK